MVKENFAQNNSNDAYKDNRAIIEAVYSEMEEISILNIKTERINVRKHNNNHVSIFDSGEFDYSTSLEKYINNYVYEKDRAIFAEFMKFSNVCNSLKVEGSINLLYRTFEEGEIHYSRVRCFRIGTADDFEEVLLVIDSEEMDASQERMLRSLEKDDVTGVYTRQAFFNRAATLLKTDQKFDIITADVENFKLINSLYGRGFGDKVLKYLGNEYQQGFSKGICARFGGDQFVILIPSMDEHDEQELYKLTEKVKNESPVQYLTVRYGVNHNVDKDDSIADMCDKAMLAVKGNKKNYHDDPVSYYDSGIIQKHVKTKMLESEFERGLAENEFVIWCQPKYNARSKVMTSAEALVRWQRKDGSFIQPGEFIPVFEADGLIEKLDEYVFRYVCTRQKELMDKGIDPIPISVNMSRASLFRHEEVKKYKKIIEGIGIPKRLVPIELTESATTDNNQIGALIDSLKSEGFSLHMDDFGSGYSSLSNLSSLHFDAIKLDKSIIDGIGTPKGEEVIRHLIGIAHFFSMEVIAEGVEQRAQYSFLKKLDCDTIQGYYFSRPVPFDEFLEMKNSQTIIMPDFGNSGDQGAVNYDAEAIKDDNKGGIVGWLSHIKLFGGAGVKLYKGEANDIYRANAFTLKCMWVSYVVLIVCWILDVLGVFIVDLRIMNIGLIGASIICLATLIYSKMCRIDRDGSRYIIMLALVAMYTFIFSQLSYHVVLVMIFPLMGSMLYFDKKVTVFTYIITCIGYGIAVMLGYKIGLCDSNMLLLTYTTSAFHIDQLLSGAFAINDNMFLMFLFFVFPRWILMIAIMPLLSHIATDIQARTKREAVVRHLAEIDGLTGLNNRYKFVQSMNNYYPNCDRIAVLYFDINNLKWINDNMGHEYGDKLICGLSEELLKRESDNCKSYRIGGDEFVMILERNDVNRVDDIHRELSQVMKEKSIEGDIQLSVAIGTATGAGKNIEDVINEADEKMYNNKLKMKEEIKS